MTRINQQTVSTLPAFTSSQLPILERLPQHTQWSLLDDEMDPATFNPLHNEPKWKG